MARPTPPRRAVLLRQPGRAPRRRGASTPWSTGCAPAASSSTRADRRRRRRSRTSCEPRRRADCAIVCGGDGSLCRAAPGHPRQRPDARHPADGHRQRPRPHPRHPRPTSRRRPTSSSPATAGGSTSAASTASRSSTSPRSGSATELARELSPDLKQRWGRLGYAIAAIRALARARRFSAWITEDGDDDRTRTMQIAVGNGRFYGGGTVVAAARRDRRRPPRPLQPRDAHGLAAGADAAAASAPASTAPGPRCAPRAAPSSRSAPRGRARSTPTASSSPRRRRSSGSTRRRCRGLWGPGRREPPADAPGLIRRT